MTRAPGIGQAERLGTTPEEEASRLLRERLRAEPDGELPVTEDPEGRGALPLLAFAVAVAVAVVVVVAVAVAVAVAFAFGPVAFAFE